MQFDKENTDHPEQETAIENEVENEPDEVEEEPVDLNASDDDDTDPDAEPEENGEGDPENEEDAVPEMVTVEADGVSYEVPKALEPMFMMQADYTRKTQEVAESRKTYEAKVEEVNKVLNISQEEMNAKAHLLGVEQRLQQYQNVDWRALEAEDPMGAQSHWREYQQLQQERGNVQNYIQTKGQERTALSSQEIAKRQQETAQYAQKNIPGWSTELDQKITEFATQRFSHEQLAQSLTPEIYEMMHLAYIGSQSLQRQRDAKPAVKSKAKPLSKVTAKSNPTATGRVEDIDDMETYAATRRKQMGF